MVLRDRGIKVLPDVVANGGGIVVSFFEWVSVAGLHPHPGPSLSNLSGACGLPSQLYHEGGGQRGAGK